MIQKFAIRILYPLMLGLALLLINTSCQDGKSYSDLLKDETRAVNWYLAQQRIVSTVPEDSVFEVGPNAPFYRMDSDGHVYMRVLSMGDMNDRPQKGQTVYLRYSCTNLLEYAAGGKLGALSEMESNMAAMAPSLIYGNTILTSTTQYGTGLQVPLGYLGYNCEVDLVVKSTEGPTDYISDCIPLLYTNLKYFKAEY